MMRPRRISAVEPDALKQLLRRHRLRATSARIAMLELLSTIDTPLTQMEIEEEVGGASHDRATMYRNLNSFTSAGLVRRVDLGDRVWRYIAQTVADRPLTGWFECTVCSTVIELDEIELRVPRGAPRAVAHKRVEIRLRGTCDDCS